MIVPDDQVATRDVASWEGLHLLHFRSSSCSQKVRVLLHEKGLDWKSHHIDLALQKHVSTWFLGINPRGVVPVLVHDGVVHVESNDIMEHLDGLPSQAQPFFPQTEAERAWVRENLELEDSLHMDLRNLTMGFIMPRRLAQKSEKMLERWEREGRQDPKRVLEVAWWRDYARHGVTHQAARASVDAHRKVFETLDARLADSAWLLGERLSVLDIAWFITARRLLLAGYPLQRHSHLARWHVRLTKRPAFFEETRDPIVLRAMLPVYAMIRRLQGTTLLEVTR